MAFELSEQVGKPMKFKTGDKVKLSDLGKDKYEDTAWNPHNEFGTIKSYTHTFDKYIVVWSNNSNSYCEKDLVLVQEELDKEEPVKFEVGDKVKLSDLGKCNYTDKDNNPHKNYGRVITSGSRIWVQWADTLCKNSYDTEDLELVEPEQPVSEWDKARAKEDEKAMRFNTGKVKLSYILDADVAMKGMCDVFEFGAKKYDRGNWKYGLDEKEIMDSLLRHLVAYNNGEVLDPESGLPHVDCITCNAVFLATFGKEKKEKKNVRI